MVLQQKNRGAQGTLEVVILRAVRVNIPGEGTRTLFPPDPRGAGKTTEVLPDSVARLLISQRQARLAPKAAAKAAAKAQSISGLSTKDAVELVGDTDDIDVLRRWIGEEEKGQKRRAVLDALDERGAELFRRLKSGGAAEEGDALEGVSFASPEAEKEARDAGLRAAHFADVGPSGKTGYTTADVRGLIEKQGSG